ncbi:MAG: DUF2007 domain-containing protein [Polyangiales bacterium]
MQTVHRAIDLVDAENARNVLVNAGIAAHIAEDTRLRALSVAPDEIRVMVDNRALDRARRTIEAWKKTRLGG